MPSKATADHAAAQTAQILKHLQSGARLTPKDALHLFGCARLGARIFELRQQGYDICRRLVATGTSAAGHTIRVAEYRLNPAAS